MLRAAERELTGSIWSRNWPLRTRSPSFTAISVTWPGMVAEMSTFRWAWTLPLAAENGGLPSVRGERSRTTATSPARGPFLVSNEHECAGR